MNFYGKDEEFKKKPITLFWTYFILTVIFSINWFYYLYAWYFGDKIIIEEFGIPDFLVSFMVWFMRIFGWILIPIFLSLTIRWYKVTRFGVKSTWKN